MFTTGNYRLIADNLASMKRSLQIVGDVPELAGSTSRLSALEDRLQGTVESKLSAALADRGSAAQVRELVGVLRSIRRPGAVEDLYLAARLPGLRALWDNNPPSPPGSFPDWLLGFVDQLVESVRSELTWGEEVLPEMSVALVAKLVVQTFRHIAPGFEARVEAAAQAGAPDQEHRRLEVLTAVEPHMGELLRALARSLRGREAAARDGAAGEPLLPVLQSAAGPLAALLLDQGRYERALLAQELGSLSLGESSPDISGTTRSLSVALPQVRIAGSWPRFDELRLSPLPPSLSLYLAALEQALAGCIGAVERSLVLSGGASIPRVIAAVDEALSNFLQRCMGAISLMEGRIRRLLRRAGAGESGESTEGAGAVADATRTAIELGDLNGQVRAALWHGRGRSTCPVLMVPVGSLRSCRCCGWCLACGRSWTCSRP